MRGSIPDARFKDILVNSNALTADTGKTDNVITLAIAFGKDLADCVYLLEQIANEGPQDLQLNAHFTAQSLRGVIENSANNNLVVQPDKDRSPLLHMWMEMSHQESYQYDPSFFISAVSQIMGLGSTGQPLPTEIRYYLGDHLVTRPDQEVTTEDQPRRRIATRRGRRLEARQLQVLAPVPEESMPPAEGAIGPMTHTIHPDAVRDLDLRNEMLIFGNVGQGVTQLEFRLGSITERPDSLEGEQLNIVCPAAPKSTPPYGSGGTFNSLLNQKADENHPFWTQDFRDAVKREIKGCQLGSLVKISVACEDDGTDRKTFAYIAMNPLMPNDIGETEASKDRAEQNLRRHYERILKQLNQSGINACQIALAMGSYLGPKRSIRALYDAIRELQHTGYIPNLQRIVIADQNPEVAQAFDLQAQAHDIAPTIRDPRSLFEIDAMRTRHGRSARIAAESLIPITREGAGLRATVDPTRALNAGDDHLSAHNNTLNLVITDNMFDYAKRLNTPNLAVNAANGNLGHGGGIAAAFVARAGTSLQRASDRLRNQLRTSIATGAFAATDAFNLNDPRDTNYQRTEAILHAVGPQYTAGPEGEASNLQTLEDLYYSLIAESHNTYNGIDLIMPLLSVGIFRVPVRLSVQALYKAVERARRVLGDNCPRVHAVLSNQHDPELRRKDAKTAFQQCLDGITQQPLTTTVARGGATHPTGETGPLRRRAAAPVESWRAQFPYIERFVDKGRMVVRPVKELVAEGKIDETTVCPLMQDPYFEIPEGRLPPGQTLKDLNENDRNALLDEILDGDNKYAVELTSTLHPVTEERNVHYGHFEATRGSVPLQDNDGNDIPCRHLLSMNGMEGILKNAAIRFEVPAYAPPDYCQYVIEQIVAYCRATCPICRVRITDGEEEFRGLPDFDG
ncbi:MAG: hypothetical protein B0D91_09200 [Oceanospirillales bacterium LUC14_002_19_P2]|nr:MAG: hypothetical protein B0D91_09200 [Oceanospirillales bacterium LUC14_002_19_P2]